MLRLKLVRSLVLLSLACPGCDSATTPSSDEKPGKNDKPASGENVDPPSDPEPIRDPSVDSNWAPDEQAPPVPKEDLTALVSSVTLDMSSPQDRIPLRLNATVKLGTLTEKYNRILAKTVCKIGDSTYTDRDREILSFDSSPPGTEVVLEDKPFGGKRWGEEGPLGDCDTWLTLREMLGSGQYRETLLATRCRREGTWKADDCAPIPDIGAPLPMKPGAVDITVLSHAVKKDRRGGHFLTVDIEYATHQITHPDWDLVADLKCSAGSETVERNRDFNGVSLSELRPGDKARAFLPDPYDAKQRLAASPERCELVISAESSGEDKHLMATACLEPGKPARAGACTTAP